MGSKASTVKTNRVKRYRHGYRGYGSPLRHEHTGAIHWGQGFAGMGVAQEARAVSLRPNLIPEELHDRLSFEDDTPRSSK